MLAMQHALKWHYHANKCSSAGHQIHFISGISTTV
jgi:hypothetical protein